MIGGRRTKIVVTIGPASSSITMLTRMISAGMTVARLNFSHGSYSHHKMLIKNIRKASRKVEKEVAILQDLQGPKIRIGELPEHGIELKKGQEVQLYSGRKKMEKDGRLPVSYDQLHKDVKKDDRLFIDDGFIETVVKSVKGRVVIVKVKNDGLVTSKKGINIPDSEVSAPALTEKDRNDLFFGLEQGIDFVSLSFVTSAEEVRHLRKIIDSKCRSIGCISPKIISKIERPEAVRDFEKILEVSDGIMIARGDLGIEIDPEDVPIVQKEMIESCRLAGKPVIVATHMMESMRHHPRATRAETSDVANAVIDHTDAVMLSAETATGDYPYTTVRTMGAIIDEAEASRFDDISFYQIGDIGPLSNSIAQSLHVMAENKQIDFIATSSTYSAIALKINVFRPNVPIIMACPNKTIARQMLLRAGINSIILSDEPGSFIHRMEAYLRKHKIVNKNSHIAYVTTSASGEVQMSIR